MCMFEDETAFVWEWLCRLGGHVDARNRPFELVFAKTDRSSQPLLIGMQLCTRSHDSEAVKSFERAVSVIITHVHSSFVTESLGRLFSLAPSSSFTIRLRVVHGYVFGTISTHARAFAIVKHSYESGIRVSHFFWGIQTLDKITETLLISETHLESMIWRTVQVPN